MEANPSKVIRYDLLVVLVGVACSLAAERFVDQHADVATRVNTASFFLTSINFLHAKTITLDEPDYNRVLVNLPGFALADFLLNISIVITFVFLSLYLNNPVMVLALNLLVRLIDVPLVLLVRRASEEPIIRKAQNGWLGFDLFSIVCFGAALCSKERASPAFVAVVFLAVISLDIIFDYSSNYHLYFASTGSWMEMAATWDSMQGHYGDIYRQKLIVPALRDIVDFANKTVLDLGCGNGCISRSVEILGAASVTAVDKYANMLEHARKYPSKIISYRQVDLDVPAQSSPEGQFDVIIACFSLQDCSDISAPLQLIRSKLAPSGTAIIIYENDIAFSQPEEHITTTRLPLDTKRHSGRGQRWLLSWNPTPTVLRILHTPAQNQDPSFELITRSEGRPHVTVTRYWDTFSYLRRATLASLAPTGWPTPISLRGDTGNHLPGNYGSYPRFSMLTLGRVEDVAATHSGALPLILIAGVSGTGKTRCGEHLSSMIPGCITLNLDDFCLPEGDPRIPLRGTNPDWEARSSVDIEAASRAIAALVNRQSAQIPIYDMATNSVKAHRHVTADTARMIVVEGLFAFEIFIPGIGLPKRLLITSSWRTLPRRLKRDLREHRRRFRAALLNTLFLWFKSYSYDRHNREIADYTVSCTASPKEIHELLTS